MHTVWRIQGPQERIVLNKLSILLFLALGLTGCGGPVFKVSHQQLPATPPPEAKTCQQDPEKCELPGIPFYAVKYRCVHTTIWLRPIYAVTLTATSDEAGFLPTSKTIFLSRSEFQKPETQQVLSSLQALTSIGDYNDAFNYLEKLKGIDPLSFDEKKLGVDGTAETGQTLLTGNNVSPERYVDAGSVYYFNAEKPTSGTVNAEIDLNEEGILSKASAPVEDKTLETILGALPISDLIKSGAGIGTAAVEMTKGKGKYKIALQLQTTIYKHTHSLPSSVSPPCNPNGTLVAGDAAFNWTVEDATAPVKKPDDSEKPKKEAKPK